MKANISSKIKKNNEIIISIGMIVKNEEKVLERCLKSLQPLMEAIPCELIIADTGSSDSTVEIAKKYTDNVFHFEWINDFAAARNSTLEKAKGQWFLFLDADEYLDDDIGEMIHFFNIPELRSKYRTIEIMVRSYTNPEKTAFADACLARFQRIDDPKDPVHFVGKVHEGIWLRYPLGYFSTILHHTGYCFSSEQQNLDKKKRNLMLMREEYSKNPDDLRMLSHLIDGCAYEPEERENYIERAIALIRDGNRNDLYSNCLYLQAILVYSEKKPEYALQLCDEYCETLDNYKKYLASVGVVLMKARILSALARYEQSYEAFKEYQVLYADYKDEKLDISDLSAHPVEGTTEAEYVKYICMAALTLMNLKRYDEGFDLLRELDVTKFEGEEFKELLGTVRELCKSKEEYSEFSYYYEKISEINDENRNSLVLFMLESTYYSIPGTEKRMKFASDIAKMKANGKYTELMTLMISQESDTFIDDLSKFVSEIDNWDDGYSEAIYLAVKHKIDISRSVDKMKPEYVRVKLEEIANHHDDFAGFVLDYGIPESYIQNIKRFNWIVALFEKASYTSFNLDDQKKMKLYQTFTQLLGNYVNNIYNTELLNEEDVEVIPPLHRFGFYMNEAYIAHNAKDKIGYIRNLKKALVNCESMKEIVEFMMKQFMESEKL